MNANLNRFCSIAATLLMAALSTHSRAEVKTTARLLPNQNGFDIALAADPSDLQLMVWVARNGMQSGVTILCEGGFHLFVPVTFDEAFVEATDNNEEDNALMSRGFELAADLKLQVLQARLSKIRENGNRALFHSHVTLKSVFNRKLIQRSLIVDGMEELQR